MNHASEKLYGDLQASNDCLDDAETLNRIFNQQGYLFFRSVLNVQQVQEVKNDFTRELQRQGFVKQSSSEPVWTGRNLEELDDEPIYSLDYYPNLLDTNTTQSFFGQLFHEPVFTFRSASIRYTTPNDEKHGSPAHQDHFYVNHTTDFKTIWIPLMDIDREMGGLAIAKRSHTQGLREHTEQNVYSYDLKGRKQKGVELKNIDEPWLTTSYRPGDILVFHPHTLHWAPTNRSEKMRLSIDVRCQPASSPRSWQSQSTLLGLRQFRREVQEIAAEEGTSPQLLEALLIEMMARGTRPEQAEVRSLIAEISVIN